MTLRLNDAPSGDTETNLSLPETLDHATSMPTPTDGTPPEAASLWLAFYPRMLGRCPVTRPFAISTT